MTWYKHNVKCDFGEEIISFSSYQNGIIQCWNIKAVYHDVIRDYNQSDTAWCEFGRAFNKYAFSEHDIM